MEKGVQAAVISPDLEESVLGGLLSRPEEYDWAFEKLKPEDFFTPAARDIFEACLSCRKEYGKAMFALLGLEESLSKYAAHCRAMFLTPTAFRDQVRGLSVSAKNQRLLQGAEEIALSGSEHAAEELERLLERERAGTTGRDYEAMLVQQMLKFSEELFSDREREKRILTGFARLDDALCGLRPGTVSYVGARPSVGKTAFALNILRNQCKAGKKCVFFSLEMSVQQLEERLLSDLLSIHYGRINRGKLDEAERSRMLQTLDGLYSQKRLFLIDDQYTVESIGAAVADLKPDFVVVDFLQCVRTVQKQQDRRNEIDYISQELKRLAKRYGCHIMGLSQLSRLERDSRAPRMSDLKESGGLEQDGDYILLLNRPFVFDQEKYSPEEAGIVLAKNKYGNTGTVDLTFRGEFQRFTEAARHDGVGAVRGDEAED